MATRPGTGKVAMYIRKGDEKNPRNTVGALQKEIEALTDKDLDQLAKGIENGTLTYA